MAQLEALLADLAERASPMVAERYTAAVLATCERPARFPMRGVAREDIRPGLRVTHHKGRTVIAYAVDAAARTVSVLGVFYGGQHYAKALAAPLNPPGANEGPSDG